MGYACPSSSRHPRRVRCQAEAGTMDPKTAMGSEPHGSQIRPDFERIALLLQGGGALGAYQGGVYQALAEADLRPHWVAGISIGAINAALIAGNPPERRVERLREFWNLASSTLFHLPLVPAEGLRTVFNEASAAWIAAYG